MDNERRGPKGSSDRAVRLNPPTPYSTGQRAQRPIFPAASAFNVMPLASRGLPKVTWTGGSLTGLGVRIRVGIPARAAGAPKSSRPVPAAWSKAVPVMGPPWLFGLVLYDATSEELDELVRSAHFEIDERTSDQVLLSYVGNPSETGPAYEALRDARLRASDERDAVAFHDEVQAGADREFMRRREVHRLIALTGIERSALPCFAFFPFPIYSPPAVLRIQRDWISSPTARRHLLDSLLGFISVTDFGQLAKDCGTNASLARRFEQLLVEQVASSLSGGRESGDPGDTCFWREGDTWLVAFAGIRCHIAHSLGMEYICQLLQNSTRPLQAALLRSIVSGHADITLGSAGEVLDRQALSDYRQRLHDLHDERAEAEANNDVGRVQQLDELVEQLTAEIGRATGLNGRVRRAADDHERARKSVSKAIHVALTAIKRHHTPLWHHLSKSLEIGTTLVYRPEQPTPWST